MKKNSIFISLMVLVIQTFSQSNKSAVKEVYISKIPRPTAPAYLIVSAITFSDKQGNNNKLLDVKENAEIKFTITNKGKGDAYNLVAKIAEKNQIKGLLFSETKIIGNLQSGKDITVIVPVSGTMQLATGKAEFEILVKEGNDFDADPFKISFNTQKFKNPQVTIADSKFTANEEGKIKLGHPVSLNIVVQNTGQGEASNVQVNFKNPSNVFPANETSFTFNTLKPNESKTINYEFFANKKYADSTIPIEIAITESYGKYGDEKTLSVSLEQSLTKTQQIDVNTQYDKPVAINNVSLSSDVDKNIPINNTSNENTFALIIGNEDYTSFQQGLSNEMNVEFASNDAQIFREYCINTFGVPKSNITFIQNATAGQMNQATDKINKLIKATDGKANVIVYY